MIAIDEKAAKIDCNIFLDFRLYQPLSTRFKPLARQSGTQPREKPDNCRTHWPVTPSRLVDSQRIEVSEVTAQPQED